MERVGPARAPALPGWDPWDPARITGVTSALPETDGSSLACSSPSGSADRPWRTLEIRLCAQRHGPRASLPATKAALQQYPRRTGCGSRVPVRSVRLTDTGSWPVQRPSWSAGVPARIKGVTAALRETDGPWLACSSRSVCLTDRAGDRNFASAGKDARGPGICSCQSPCAVSLPFPVSPVPTHSSTTFFGTPPRNRPVSTDPAPSFWKLGKHSGNRPISRSLQNPGGFSRLPSTHAPRAGHLDPPPPDPRRDVIHEPRAPWRAGRRAEQFHAYERTLVHLHFVPGDAIFRFEPHAPILGALGVGVSGNGFWQPDTAFPQFGHGLTRIPPFADDQ